MTYPRTDSQYLTDDMEENALLVVGAVNSMFPEMSIKGSEPDIKRLLNSKKVSDHHAIIPTVEITNMDLKALPETNCQGLFHQIHKKIYKKGARSTAWLLTPRLTAYIFPSSRSLQRYA